MARITINPLIDNTAQAIEEVKRRAHTALEAVGHTAEGYAKKECPVATGRLKNSITHKVDDSTELVYIGSNVEYAPEVEYNDKAVHKVGNAHFLRNAAVNHTDEYNAIIKAALES